VDDPLGRRGEGPRLRVRLLDEVRDELRIDLGREDVATSLEMPASVTQAPSAACNT
jgi:hypothetical protein